MINLYYDRITDGLPCPNGTDYITYTTNAYQIPVVKNQFKNEISIVPYTEFYFMMKFTNTPVKLFTGTQRTKNLFYPIEITESYIVESFGLTTLIKPKVKNKIKKGVYKLLLICNKIPNTQYDMGKFKHRIEELVNSGINKNNIYIILSDVTASYKNFLNMPNVFGIDWQQIYTQVSYKARYEDSSIQYFFPFDNTMHYCNTEEKEKEIFNFDDWQPKKLFTALTGQQNPWDISLIIELLHHNLEDSGTWYFNKDTYNFPNRLDDVIDLKLPMQEYSRKQQILKELETKSIFVPNSDRLKFDNSIYHDSLFNIVSDDIVPTDYSLYPDSVLVTSPGINIWRQIAQGHPFVVLGNLNAMQYLNNQGYFSYNELIYHNFDGITYTPKKVKLLVEEIKRLSLKSNNEIEQIKSNITAYAKKNREKFFNKNHSRIFQQLFIDMRYEPVV